MITITAKREVLSNEKHGWRITGFNMLDHKKLPNNYINGEIMCYKRIGYRVDSFEVSSEHGKSKVYEIGSFLVPEEMDTLLENLHNCGDNLMLCNKRLKKLKKEWNGTHTFKI